MKIRIDVECSPEEARAFFGLPDMGPVHKAFVEEMERKMRAGMAGLDVDAVMRAWMPGAEALEQFRKVFWPGPSGQNPSGQK